MKIICKICKKGFLIPKSGFSRRRCCSNKCSNIWKSIITKGRKQTEEHKRKIGQANKGKKRKPFSAEWRKNISKAHKGKRHYWKPGIMHAHGYVLIKKPDNPRCQKKGYVLEHRLKMEEHLGRHLNDFEYVHHRNGIKDDNRIENLELTTRKMHLGKVLCPYCNKEFSIR